MDFACKPLSPVFLKTIGDYSPMTAAARFCPTTYLDLKTGTTLQLIAHKVNGYGAVVMTNANRGGEVANEVIARIETAYGWDSLEKPVPRWGGAGHAQS